MANFGVRAGYVWRGERNQYGALQHQPARTPRSPCRSRCRDPGPDGTVGNADDGPAIAAFDLPRRYSARLPPVNQTVNVDDSDADFHTFEITGTKRMSNRWSLLASYGWTKSFEQASDYPGQRGPQQRAAGDSERRDQHRGRPARVSRRSTSN